MNSRKKKKKRKMKNYFFYIRNNTLIREGFAELFRGKMAINLVNFTQYQTNKLNPLFLFCAIIKIFFVYFNYKIFNIQNFIISLNSGYINQSRPTE